MENKEKVINGNLVTKEGNISKLGEDIETRFEALAVIDKPPKSDDYVNNGNRPKGFPSTSRGGKFIIACKEWC